jgi:hypothetical protein
MTTRHLKIDKEWIMGKNGKKLRYLFDENNKTIVLKAPSNWGENAQDDLADKYEDFTVKEDIVKKRGRPKKVQRKEESKTKFKSAATVDTSDDEEYDFNIGDRVKSDNSLGVGTIIEITNRKKAKIKFSDKYTEIIHFRYIKKARGRKAKEKLFVDEEAGKETDKEAELLEILKHDGKMYLINNINEVMTMSGDYVGLYENGEITE